MHLEQTKGLKQIIARLHELCRAHSACTVVSPAPDGSPDWVIEGGKLRHACADYFSLGMYALDHGGPLLLIQQKETALVMLLVAEIGGQRCVLLSLRTEPGLIGLTNFSTTIQSTPSNYLRKHGGKSTPFLEVAIEPHAHGTVLYEGEHHDWGDFYHNKTKRFLIVELASPVEAPPGFSWVGLETAHALLLEDNLVTNDLRVSIPLVDSKSPSAQMRQSASRHIEPRIALKILGYRPGVTDSRGAAVSFFKTDTETREVRSWIQPLLIPNGILEVRLAFTRTASGKLFALEKRTQPGLLGRRLWFPAAKEGGRVARMVTTSAEGGRFWRYRIDIQLVEVESFQTPANDTPESAQFVSEDELARLVAQSLQTSLELRMAWSLVRAERSRAA